MRLALTLTMLVALAGPADAQSRRKLCKQGCGALIATCASTTESAGFGKLAKACKKAVLKRCRQEGPEVCGEFCGNGTASGAEACDGADLGGATCQSLGFVGGTLGCTPGCRHDTGSCTPVPAGLPTTCGNGTIEAPEQCDGANLGGATCLGLGFASGTLGCTTGCAYDLTTCQARASSTCGDGIVDPLEQCDGADLGGATCRGLGFLGGDLLCTANCAFDTSVCTRSAASTCGDGFVDVVEQCDGASLGGQTCVSLGFASGNLGCTQTCGFDLFNCFPSTVPRCGNGRIDFRELCDGGDLGGATCEALGYGGGGTLACTSGCAFDISGCRGQRFAASGQTTSYLAFVDSADTSEAVPDDGALRAGAQRVFVDNGNGTITDRNTGLTWTKQSDGDGFFDKDDRYRWTIFNAGQVTIWQWLDALQGFAGHRDWRIPNARELATLIDYGRSSPAIHPAFDSNCIEGCSVSTCSCTAHSAVFQEEERYWSSTTYDDFTGNAWFVDFDDGDVSHLPKESALHVRAVRGP